MVERLRADAADGRLPETSLGIQCIVVDCHDPRTVAEFWQQALGWRRTVDGPDEIVVEPPAGTPADGIAPDLLFLPVSDPTPGKNRLHLDLRPADQDAELARLEALGARRVDIGQGMGRSWIVMADPEGNEFCLLRAYSPTELAQIAAETRGPAES